MRENEKYREILISPVRECAKYMPKFGHKNHGGFSLQEFQDLYGNDTFYSWLGLDNPLMYSAHKAAGGITSVYRQIGTGCEKLVREIFKDKLQLTEDEVNWSYTVTQGKKAKTFYLDGRISIDEIKDPKAKERVKIWKETVSNQLSLSKKFSNAMSGFVFEIRQGYKSNDSKRQNADIANATHAYTSGYIPCLMVMSSQIDDAVSSRYLHEKWLILQGNTQSSSHESTYSFFKDIIGFDLAEFMNANQDYFKLEIRKVLDQLLRAE